MGQQISDPSHRLGGSATVTCSASKSTRGQRSTLLREKDCVLNLLFYDMIPQANAMARTTGSAVVPEFKVILGYRHEKDKFKTAGLTPTESETVQPDRIKECPVQMEAEMAGQ